MAQAMLEDNTGDINNENIGENITRGKYRNFTTAFKLSAISEARSSSIRSVGRKYNVNESTVRGWIKNEDKLKELLTVKDITGNNTKLRLPGGGRKSLSEDMEQLLYDWIIARRARNLRVTAKSICDQAVIFFNTLTPCDEGKFIGSRGWFARHKLTLRKNHPDPKEPSGHNTKSCEIFIIC